MGFIGQGTPHPTSGSTSPVMTSDLRAGRDVNDFPTTRISWLFSGIVLGAGSWLLLLGVIFAAFGKWIVAGALLGGLVLTLLVFWSATRRLRTGGRGRP